MNAIVMLTHVLNAEIARRFAAIQCPASCEKFILFDASAQAPPAWPQVVRSFRLADLVAAGYRPLARSLIPGSNHFPVIEFALAGGYDFTWCIEFDSLFLGNWGDFLAAQASDADLLTALIVPREADPHWHWWTRMRGPAPLPRRLLKSFNPVYRLSARGAAYLRREFQAGWVGHHEVTMPTLLHAAGYQVEDFGGTGEFVRPENRGRWYQAQTYSFRRFPRALLAQSRNILVHPIKL